MVAVGGRSLSTDLLLEGRLTSVELSDSEGVIVEAVVEAIDMLLACSGNPVDEAILVVRVCVPGAVG